MISIARKKRGINPVIIYIALKNLPNFFIYPFLLPEIKALKKNLGFTSITSILILS